jgi:hypothetical protein
MGERAHVAPRIRAGEPPGHTDTLLREQRRRGGGRYPRPPRTLVNSAGEELLMVRVFQVGGVYQKDLGPACRKIAATR